MGGFEHADVVVVGARCAGSAVASVLARSGRRVVVLDRVRFPADTLSTHVFLPSGVAELQRIGALRRIRALKPAESYWVSVHADDVEVRERWATVDGIGYGVCIPRYQQDFELVQSTREHGADVRERVTVEDVLWRAGRAVGVRYREADGSEREIRAKLVVGADGRRSTIAARVGAWRPYRASRNGRGLAFRYMDDPLAGTPWHATMSQWRRSESRSYGYTFPCPDGRMVLLWMVPAEDIARLRRDAENGWAELLREHPGVAGRVAGATNLSKLRSTGDVTSFFRPSSGPGWVLAGDAGHFKDPIIGQGMHDAVRGGRTLAEAVAPVLDDPPALDGALRVWEHARDRDVLPSYHWANRETRPATLSPFVQEVLRTYENSAQTPDLGDTFNRIRMPHRIIGPRHIVPGLLNALRRRGVDRRAVLYELLREAPAEIDIRLELRAGRFRYAGRSATENPEPKLPPEPLDDPPARAPEPAKEAAAV